MPILEPHHDLAHAVEPDTAWSESYYFNAYDPDTESGLFTRVGIRPIEGTMDVGLSIWLPGGDLAEYRHQVECHEMREAPLEVGGVRYELVEPMQRWRLVADVEASARRCARDTDDRRRVAIELDLTFEGVTPPVGSDGGGSGPGSKESSAAGTTTGKGHFEQAGSWSGTLQVDGVTHTWSNALGNRDRSWGPRRWGGPSMWRWFSINIGDVGLHLGGIRLGTDAGDLHRGWVSENGRVTSIGRWELTTDLDDDQLTHQVVHLQAIDKSDRTYDLTGRVLRVADIGRPGGTVINEGLTEWTYRRADGTVAVGYGIAEYLHQVDEHGSPRIPVS